MIDIHTHLLPGVDDGSPTATHSATVLQRMAGEGVRQVVCTPHLNASQAHAAPVEQRAQLLDQLRSIGPSEVTLHPGWEIMLDCMGADLTSATLALGGSRARLVEFPRRGLPQGSTEELLRLRATGLIPVVAHPERYGGCSLATVRTWRELGAVIQTDSTALVAGGTMADLSRGMLTHGLIDILASDNHGDRRSLSVAKQWMSELGGSEQAAILTEENPRRLLADQPLLPVPAFQLGGGFLDRLRALLTSFRRQGNPDE